MPSYFIILPKQELILNEKLEWKKFSDCAEGTDSAVLGLDLEDALRVSDWLSISSSASTYPEDTMLKKAKKEMGETFQLSICRMTRADFDLRIQEGVYPAVFSRKPVNKAEKKILSRRLSQPGKQKERKDGPEAFAGVTKEQLSKSDIIGKGEDSMYYIVKLKKAMFLTKALTWISIDEIRRHKKQLSQLFAVKNDITQAQNICQWVSASGENVCPCTPNSLKRKFSIVFPNTAEDSLQAGLRTHRYPPFLGRKPSERKEIVAFQMELRHGLRGLEERMTQALGKPESTKTQDEGWAGGFAADSEAKAAVELLESKYDDFNLEQFAGEDDILSGKVSEDGVCQFKNWSVSVAESSELIRKMVDSSIAFGEIMSDVPSLLAERKLDLEMIQRQLVDLDHMAEFYNLNAADGFRLNKNRQEILKKRRIIKNEIFVLELASSYFDNGATPSKIRSFVHSVMGMDRRHYMPRAMTISDVKKIVQNPKTQSAIIGDAEQERRCASASLGRGRTG